MSILFNSGTHPHSERDTSLNKVSLNKKHKKWSHWSHQYHLRVQSGIPCDSRTSHVPGFHLVAEDDAEIVTRTQAALWALTWRPAMRRRLAWSVPPTLGGAPTEGQHQSPSQSPWGEKDAAWSHTASSAKLWGGLPQEEVTDPMVGR